MSWLGVTQYLTGDAIARTLEVIGRLGPGTELVMEYLLPAELRDQAGQALADFFMPRAAAFAEPWLTFLTPADVHGLLAAARLTVVEDVGRREQVDPMLWKRCDALRPHQLRRVTRAIASSPPTTAATPLSAVRLGARHEGP